MIAFALAALLASDYLGWTAGMRVEGRERTSATVQTQNGPAGEVQLDPLAELTAHADTFQVLATYAPRLILSDAPDAQKTEFLHRGGLRADWSVDRTLLLRFEQQVLFGRQSFSPLTVSGTEVVPPTLDRLPDQQSLEYFQSSTALSAEHILSGRLRLSETFTWLASGGVGAQAREALPVIEGPRLEARLSWAATRLDRLVIGVGGSLAQYSGGGRTQYLLGSLSWLHSISRFTEFELGAGAGVGNETGGVGPPKPTEALPIGIVGIHSSFPLKDQVLDGALRFTVTPVADRISGALYARGELTASSSWSPLDKLGFRGRFSAVRAVSSADYPESRLAEFEVAAYHPISGGLSVLEGVRGTWLPPTLNATNLAFAWATFLTVSITGRGVM